jgi:hypothetical protein
MARKKLEEYNSKFIEVEKNIGINWDEFILLFFF